MKSLERHSDCLTRERGTISQSMRSKVCLATTWSSQLVSKTSTTSWLSVTRMEPVKLPTKTSQSSIFLDL